MPRPAVRTAQVRAPRPAVRRAAIARLAQLVESGIPIAAALEAGGRAGGSAGAVLTNMSRSVARGRRLSQALATVTGCTRTEIALIAAGENSGRLDRALALLHQRMTSQAQARHQLLRAALYPAVLVALTILIVTAMGAFVVPTFASMYTGLGVELPASTRAIIAFAGVALRHGVAICLAAVAIGLAAYHLIHTRPRLRLSVDTLLLKLPFFGKALLADAKHDIYATLAALIDSGMELDRAIELTGPAITNTALRRSLSGVGDLVQRGWLPSAAVVRAGLDPRGDDAGLIRTAEATGRYAECFAHLAAVAGAQRDERMQTFSRLLEPSAVLIMAAAVAITVVGVYQPILGSATLLIGDLK